jgi:hypothetical protein
MHAQDHVAAIKAALAAGPTDGEWQWTVHDHSAASLGVGADPGSGTPLVLSIAICPSCAIRSTAWQWGRCSAPKEKDAAFIAACNPVAIRALLDRLAEAERKADKKA